MGSFLDTKNAIFAWYQLQGRHHLPWRQTKDAYAIYLSEIMLQQTQVKTVLERFYFPFLKRFPSLKSVAQAPLDDVLKAWEGLGYYTRARNLHHTAIVCNGILPRSPEELGGLRGIGKSTAHAICAFAYDQALPILDANVKRILCRHFGLALKDEKILWEKAWKLLHTQHPYEHNQAMMDIGALICTPKEPKCKECPLVATCRGKNSPQSYPKALKKAKVPMKKRYALVCEYEGKYGLFQRKEKLLHGLWGFIQTDKKPENAQSMAKVTHAYSHFKLELEVFYVLDQDASVEAYFTPKEIEMLALSTVDKKILKAILAYKDKAY